MCNDHPCRTKVPGFIISKSFIGIAVSLSLAAATGHEVTRHSTDITASPDGADLPKDMRWKPEWRDKGDCGPISLYLLMRLMGEDVTLRQVKSVLSLNPEMGCLLADIARAAEQLGLETQIRFVKQTSLTAHPGPFIYHSDGSLKTGAGHFGVVVGYLDERKRFVTIETEFEDSGLVPVENVLDRYSGYILVPRSVVQNTTAWYERIVLFAVGTVFAGIAFLCHVTAGRS